MRMHIPFSFQWLFFVASFVQICFWVPWCFCHGMKIVEDGTIDFLVPFFPSWFMNPFDILPSKLTFVGVIGVCSLSMTAILDGWSEYNEVANSKWFLLEYPLRNQTPPWGLPGSQRTCDTLENETREVQGWLSVPYKKGLEVEAREISQNGNRFVSIANNVCSMNHHEQHHSRHGTLRPASGKSKSDPGLGAQVANKQHGHELSGDRGKSAGWSVL